MKNVHLISLAIAIVTVTGVLVFSSSKAVNQRKSNPDVVTGIPDDVMKIFQNSCMKCHGAGGNSMAMSVVNFSIWDTYPAKKQAKKSNAICNILSKGAMPPESFRTANPDKVPTAAQTELVCKWAASLNVPKK
jgi:hypothetical protein